HSSVVVISFQSIILSSYICDEVFAPKWSLRQEQNNFKNGAWFKLERKLGEAEILGGKTGKCPSSCYQRRFYRSLIGCKVPTIECLARSINVEIYHYISRRPADRRFEINCSRWCSIKN